MKSELDDEVDQSRFSTKELHALDALGVHSLRQFLALDVDLVLGLRGCGRGTHERLLAVQAQLHRRFFSKEITTQAKGASSNGLPVSLIFLSLRQKLGGRARHALERLGLKTLREFLAVTEKDVSRLPWVGAGAWREIAALQRDIAHSIAKRPHAARDHAENYALWTDQPASWERLRQMPFYCSMPMKGLTAGDLDETYLADMPLSHVLLPFRARTTLAQMGIKTIGDLLLTPSAALMKQPNFGDRSLRSLSNTVRDLVLSRRRPCGEDLDFTSFKTMVRSFVHCALGKRRDSEITLEHLGLGQRKAPTYESLAKRYNLTRERIRQILEKELKVLSLPSKLDVLNPFWTAAAEIVEKGECIVGLSDLSDDLRRHFDWQRSPGIGGLARLLALSPAFQVNEDGGIACAANFSCVRCEEAPKGLAQICSDMEAAHVLAVGNRLADYCRAHCSQNMQARKSFPPVFVEFVGRLLPEVVVVDNDRVYSFDRWHLLHGNTLKDVVYATLKTMGKPCHYTEIAEQIRRLNMRYSSVSGRQVHDCLIFHDVFRIAGRGTYGLASWKLRPYKTHAKAVIELLERHGDAMEGTQIISELTRNGEFKAVNIQGALKQHPRILKVGDDTYDLRERVEDN